MATEFENGSANYTNDTTPIDSSEFDMSLSLYAADYKYTSVIFFSILFIIGFVGNILVIYVVYRSPKLRTLTNFYLVSLAVADCMVLFSGTLVGIPQFFFYKDQWIYGAALCSIFVFLQYLGINASALSITAFTVERYIGVCHPMKAQLYCTPRRAKSIIVGLWIFSVCYNACWLYLAHTQAITLLNEEMIAKCTFRISRKHYSAIFMVDLLLFYVLPLILTCVLYTLISLSLHKSTKDMSKPLNPQAKVKPTIQHLIMDKSINKDFRQSLMGDRKDILKKMEVARFQIVKMLIVIVVLFAVLWLPYRAWLVYNSFADQKQRFYNKWYFLVARLMIFLNSAINPALYSAMSKKFRNAFIQYTYLRHCFDHKPATKPIHLASRRRVAVRRTPVVRYRLDKHSVQDTITESFSVECTTAESLPHTKLSLDRSTANGTYEVIIPSMKKASQSEEKENHLRNYGDETENDILINGTDPKIKFCVANGSGEQRVTLVIKERDEQTEKV